MIANEQAEQRLLRFQQGDKEALEHLYLHFKPMLYSFLYRYTQDRDMSIEIVQDTFVRLQTYRQHYQPGRVMVRTYLFRIAYRLLLDRINRPTTRWREPCRQRPSWPRCT
jgi:RNA polymerase sigma-70 factor (ECF subfamily)